MEKEYQKENKKVLENIGVGPNTELEDNQNLIGFFAEFLMIAREVNPEKYLDGYKERQ